MHTRMALTAAGVLAALTLSTSPGAAQRPQATFRSEVNYVEVDVVVTDASGAFVHGLTADDFELLEEGRPQDIQAFHEINVPVERADRTLYSDALIHPDVVSNEATAQGRVYLLVLDDLHTRPESALRVRRSAREFVERYVGSNDLVAVLHTSGRANASQDFTSNRALVLQSIDGFMGRGLNSAVLNRIDDFLTRPDNDRENDPRPAVDRDARERVAAARGMFLTVRNLADYLASLSGRRKALLLFSEGTDLESDAGGIGAPGTFSEMQDARTAMLDAIGAATRANVHVYSIDATGMAPAGPGADLRIPTQTVTEQGLDAQALARERRSQQASLRTLADQTGGVAIVNTNAFDEGFARIVRENSTYYLLGYYPESKRDGKFHRIAVRVKKPGLQVRARAGYHAAKDGGTSAKTGTDSLDTLIAGAVPSAGLPMRIAVPAFKHTTAEARVWMAIDVPAGVFRFEESGGVAAEDLRVIYQVLDPAAKVVASASQDVQMRLRPETRAAVEQAGFRVVFPVQVKPGRYQVRVAARTLNGAREGSIFTDLLVPDFFQDALVWSGVSLSSAAAVQVPTRPFDPDLARAFPLMPAAVREFSARDTLAFYAEAYDTGAGAAHMVDLTAVVRDDTGNTVFKTSEERSSAELAGGRGGFGFRAQIPLTRLPPGAYVLTLTAASRSGNRAPATRDIPFTIGIS